MKIKGIKNSAVLQRGDTPYSINMYPYGNGNVAKTKLSIDNINLALTASNVLEVNYNGTAEQWNNINIGEGNSKLLNATRNYI